MAVATPATQLPPLAVVRVATLAISPTGYCWAMARGTYISATSDALANPACGSVVSRHSNATVVAATKNLVLA